MPKNTFKERFLIKQQKSIQFRALLVLINCPVKEIDMKQGSNDK
ncbi:unnamed protein product [Paramecium primaurelia]|uniref:Uncharacterized protein n=1 Tax=Paramecium primaurelia TaxID=5886 RepID=A0A8S1PNF7_PARPR|nr:unnamed protein product [Paramecium primaurelia]